MAHRTGRGACITAPSLYEYALHVYGVSYREGCLETLTIGNKIFQSAVRPGGGRSQKLWFVSLSDYTLCVCRYIDTPPCQMHAVYATWHVLQGGACVHRFVLAMTLFSLTTPIGITIAWAVTSIREQVFTAVLPARYAVRYTLCYIERVLQGRVRVFHVV
jgi:hypothetical protein